ncbi:pentatricopeptide repeat-containing protein At5g56310-like [Silene latifolia]|uniref:pentatricopeptide repeat-containing protein At5g56310-like n=1 Tax=Silene latifolia TaxID=37657 RepID=UPI003D778B9E
MPKLEMFPPKLKTMITHRLPPFSLLADKCTTMHHLKQLHAQMIILARIHDNYAASRLLSFCALSSSGDIGYAIKLFNYAQEPNNFMYNTLIRAHASSQHPYKALLMFVEMMRNGVTPGKHTFPFLLKGCACLKWVFGCKQIHACVVKYGFDFNLHVVNGLVRGYSVCGSLGRARQVFDESPGRDLSVWTSLICGYAQNNCSNEALLLFDRMVRDGIEPNGATLASVLSACAEEGCLVVGERIESFIREKSGDFGVILGTALVHMYVKNGAVAKARDVFEGMKEKNVATWNAMIQGLGVHGHGAEALDLFCKFEEEGFVPNGITLVAVLSACCHGGFLEQGREFFHSMRTRYKIEPKLEHYGCMVDLLGRQGKLLEAEQLIQNMEWKADVMIWGSLLSACAKCGNVEVAERVVEEIFALDSNNHGVRVVLSNMYAEAGRWDEVSRLRKVMKEGKFKKTPGWSSVDCGG